MLCTEGVLIEGYKARFYDFENFFYGVHHITNRHVKMIQLQPGDQVLDVGCGTAKALRRLYKQMGNMVSLYGIDPSADMIATAQQKLDPTAPIQVATGIGEQLDFRENSFDWVISCLTPHHLPLHTRAKMIRECYRVLRPGGRLIISDFGQPTNWIGHAGGKVWQFHAYVRENLNNEVLRMIEETGFQHITDQVQLSLIHHTIAYK